MTPTSDPPDEHAFPEGPVSDGATLALLARIKDGDAAAFEELYGRYHDELLFAVRAHLGRRLRAALESEDVLQSVAIDAFQALPRFEPRADGSLKHYLHKMIVNKIRARAGYFNAAKRAGTQPLSETQAGALPGREGGPEYRSGERFVRLERALELLPDETREVVVLRKVDGLPSREVAELLGKSDVAVRKLYSRGIARLTLLMREAEDTD